MKVWQKLNLYLVITKCQKCLFAADGFSGQLRDGNNIEKFCLQMIMFQPTCNQFLVFLSPNT